MDFDKLTTEEMLKMFTRQAAAQNKQETQDALIPADEKEKLHEIATTAMGFVQFLEDIAGFAQHGVLDAAKAAAEWLHGNGLDADEPQNPGIIILAAARRAIADGDEIIAKLQEFKAASDAHPEQGNIYEMMHYYGAAFVPVPVNAKQTKQLCYPVDKVNNTVWQDIEPGERHLIKAEKDGNKKELSIAYSIDFDAFIKPGDVTISKALTPFDKRVYCAAAALYKAGNVITTASKICELMGGGKGSHATNQIAKINDSLDKMLRAVVTVDNREEASEYTGYPHYSYTGALLPHERINAVVNGQPVDSAIHFFRMPPLISFAMERKQITTIPVKLLQSPVSMTEANMAIDDYLIVRIARAKDKKEERILFKTLFEKCGITEKKQKQRAPDKITAFLDHYKSCGFIAGYSTDKDGIAITTGHDLSTQN